LLLLAGCEPTETPEATKAASKANLPPKGTTLRLAVVDDPAMATAIEQLRGEWSGQSGYELTVTSITEADLSVDTLQADAVIGPSSQLGLLAEKEQILPLPDELVRNDHGSWSEVFPLLRSRELNWGSEAMAVPFGSPVLTCYYRADLLEKLGRKPPSTWTDYNKLAAMLADRAKLGDAAPAEGQPWHGALEPLGPGWAGITLLARAAAYASHRGNYSVLFNVDTMEPLIAGPPFVRALEELVATAGSGDVAALKCDPAAVRKAFWEGQCGLALSWPSAADATAATPGGSFQVGFAEMPGSEEVFNVSDQAWEHRREGESGRVPLLTAAGRLGVVLKTSQWPDASFQLLLWLSDKQWSLQVSPVSPATTLFRESHVKTPGAWAEKPVPATAAADYALLTLMTLSREQYLSVVRIPGRAEYLAALDDAVGRAVRGEQKPQEALTEASARWREITGRLGVEAQRKAYSRSLGLD
jgi:multiple sugar transport system substrate-binding protein